MKRLVTSLALVSLIGLTPAVSSAVSSHKRAAGAATPHARQRAAGGSPRAAEAAVDGGWPRGYVTPGGARVVLYQPQVASWEGQRRMVAYAAASYLREGAKKPELGTLKVEADTEVSLTERLVRFSVLKITETNFQTLPKEQTHELVNEIDKAIPPEDRFFALDRVL